MRGFVYALVVMGLALITVSDAAVIATGDLCIASKDTCVGGGDCFGAVCCTPGVSCSNTWCVASSYLGVGDYYGLYVSTTHCIRYDGGCDYVNLGMEVRECELACTPAINGTTDCPPGECTAHVQCWTSPSDEGSKWCERHCDAGYAWCTDTKPPPEYDADFYGPDCNPLVPYVSSNVSVITYTPIVLFWSFVVCVVLSLEFL